MQSSGPAFARAYQHSLYFMRGTDPTLLNPKQQKSIHQILSTYHHSSSFLLFNPQAVRNKLLSWNRQLPWIRPYYAVKSNPIDVMLKEVVKGGAGLDCASKNQIQAAINLSMKSKDIVYSNPMKDEGDLKWAYQQGIVLTTADTIGQLKKINAVAPGMKILWRISITEESTDKLATPFSVKFGDDVDSIQYIHARMKEIQGLGIKLQGIHFHCGSGPEGSSAFKKAVILSKQCMKIGRQYGHRMETLDIGGGFPSGELNKSTIEALELTKDDPLKYQVIAQPGRHFSAYSCYLLTKILGKRLKKSKTGYHLNESVYHSFNCTIMDGVTLEGSPQLYSKINKSGEIVGVGEKENASLFGMTCCGGDIICNNIEMEKEMDVGDWICFSGMGAYTYGPRSQYNGMNSLENIIVWDHQESLKEISSTLV